MSRSILSSSENRNLRGDYQTYNYLTARRFRIEPLRPIASKDLSNPINAHNYSNNANLNFYSYAKQRLVSLHPNVMVQRSPSHFQTGTFYWAHVLCFHFSHVTLCLPLGFSSPSTRRCVLSIRQSRSWEDLTSVLDGTHCRPDETS